MRFFLRLLPLLPLGWIAYRFSMELPEDPFVYLMTWTGYPALFLLMATVAVTPLYRLTRINLYKVRRYIGLWSFAYGFLHLAAYFFLELEGSAALLADSLAKRPYIFLGGGALAILTAMAVTSIPALFRRYRSIHRLVDLAALLIIVHVSMAQKRMDLADMTLDAAFLALLALRFFLRRNRGNPAFR